MKTKLHTLSTDKILKAVEKLKPVVRKTPLEYNHYYSEKYNARIYFKREDLQVVRSYKIRGAYNKISSFTKNELAKGIVCASAGNHAQGVALSCSLLEVTGTVFMPETTPEQKVNRVKMLGKNYVKVILTGDTFDQANEKALSFAAAQKAIFIHPFDDEKVIEGQATVGVEIQQALTNIDFLFMPIGGGGLAAGVSSWFKATSPKTKLIGIEPLGAPAMNESIHADIPITLRRIDKFVDGAAVQRVGDLSFRLCKSHMDSFSTVPEGKVCSTILELYNQEAIVAEPAGALTVSSLDFYANDIKGKNVVCIISGGNNDITRTEEIKERSLLYEGLKHYFIVQFPQRPGALKEFVNNILGPNDNIVHFEYSKKTNREKGPALVGIELANEAHFAPLMEKMKMHNFYGEYVNENPVLFEYLF